jgi:hypothetical protein
MNNNALKNNVRKMNTVNHNLYLLLIVLWSMMLMNVSTAYGHAGKGDPIIANVEIPQQDVFTGDRLQIVIHVFDINAVEAAAKGEPFATPEVDVTVTNGEQQMKVNVTRMEKDRYAAVIEFPTAGKWHVNAHVYRAGTQMIHDGHRDDAAIYETVIKVKYPIERYAPIWVWGAFVIFIIGQAIFLIMRRRKRKPS